MGPVEVERKYQQRIVRVSANAVGRDLGSVSDELEAKFRAMPMPAGFAVRLGGQTEQQREAFGSLYFTSLLALILVYPTFLIPFASWLLMGYFRTISRELEDAALVDGATRLQAMTRIVLPLAIPGVLSAGIFCFTLGWNEFLYALSFTQTPENRTVPVAIFTFSTTTGGGFEIPWGPMMAATVVVTLPLIILTLIFQRRILAGLTAGAVKG